MALAVPNFSRGYSQFQLNKTADDLLSVSRWAQAMAIGQERTYALTFPGDRRSYQLQYINSENNSDGTPSFVPVKGTLGRSHMVPDNVHLDIHDDNIEFYPDGTIDPATVELSSSGKKIGLSTIEERGMMTKVDNE